MTPINATVDLKLELLRPALSLMGGESGSVRKLQRALATYTWLSLMIVLVGCKPPAVRALLDGKQLFEHGQYEGAAEKFRVATAPYPH